MIVTQLPPASVMMRSFTIMTPGVTLMIFSCLLMIDSSECTALVKGAVSVAGAVTTRIVTPLKDVVTFVYNSLKSRIAANPISQGILSKYNAFLYGAQMGKIYAEWLTSPYKIDDFQGLLIQILETYHTDEESHKELKVPFERTDQLYYKLCGEKKGMSQDELYNFWWLMNKPETLASKCFVHCALRQHSWVDENGYLDRKRANLLILLSKRSKFGFSFLPKLVKKLGVDIEEEDSGTVTFFRGVLEALLPCLETNSAHGNPCLNTHQYVKCIFENKNIAYFTTEIAIFLNNQRIKELDKRISEVLSEPSYYG